MKKTNQSSPELILNDDQAIETIVELEEKQLRLNCSQESLKKLALIQGTEEGQIVQKTE